MPLANWPQRVPKLFADLALARGDGRYARIMRSLNGVQLLILDDGGLDPLAPTVIRLRSMPASRSPLRSVKRSRRSESNAYRVRHGSAKKGDRYIAVICLLKLLGRLVSPSGFEPETY